MKLKQLLASALLLCSIGATAQTDVTSTYITNADFSSTDGWTQDHSSQYWSLGNGLIGTYAVANDKKSSTDATHLATEYCLGIQCRWSTNYAAFTQTTSELPIGSYTLTFDVQNKNASNNVTYENRFKVTVGGNTFTDTKTEWMKGSSDWTTHTITFNVTEASTATISLGYGTSNNNIGSGSTPHLYVSHLSLTWTDPLKASKDALQAEIDKAKLCDAKEGLAAAISTAEGVLASATTTAELEDALATLQAADKDAVLRYENGLADATALAPVATDFVVNGTFTDNVSGWTCTGGFQNQARATNQNGAFTVPFFENWNGSAKENKMYQTINNIPNGTYRLDIAAFVNTLADPNESQYVYANSDKVYLTTGEPTAYEVWTVVTNNQVEIGLEQTTATANWMGIDNVSLRYYGAGDVISAAQNANHKLVWEEAKAAAEAAIANDAYTNVTGNERTDLATEIAKAEPSTAEAYDTAAEALVTATAAFTAAKDSYDAYAEANGIATTLEATAVTSPTTAAEAVTRAQELYVNIDTKVTSDYHDITSKYEGSFSGSFTSTTSGQHWSDDGSKPYLDNWGGGIISTARDVTLPAGSYVLKTAGRGAADAVPHKLYMSANGTTVNFPNNGDTGKGIDTGGAVNYGEGTYANNNIGRGWEWRFIPVTLDEETKVTVTLTMERSGGNTWGSFCDFTILCDDDTYAPIELEVAKAELKAVIDAAPAVREANIGDGAFQIAAAGVETYSGALVAANAAYEDGDATVLSLEEAKTTFESAIETYNSLEINAPAEGELFNVILTYDGYQYNNKAVTYMAGDRADMGNYNIKYNAPANQNLAQAFTFTKVSGNNYKMSQIDGDGNVRYVSTGVPYGGNTSQIRTTTVAKEALVVTVIPTATEGVWNLYNTEANNYIGSQDAGFFTVNSHIDFNIVETSKPSITINTTAAGWGSVILPFAQNLPEGVKAYSVNELDGDKLTLVGVDALEANKPYIIEGTWNATVEGDALGTALNYTDGLLTGVYAATDAPVGTYVLQKHEDKVGFYQVESVQPTVGANRAYLTVPAASEVKAFFLGDTATAIQNVFNGVASGEVYDLSGRKVAKMQRGGAYIINGQKVIVK